MAHFVIEQDFSDLLVMTVKDSKVFFIVFLALGIILLTLSILKKFNIIQPPAHYFYLFLALGIGFFAIPWLFLLQPKPSKITFNKRNNTITIVEGTDNIQLPFEYIDKITIGHDISKLSNSKPNELKKYYQLNLLLKSGTSICMSVSDDLNTLKTNAEKIQKLLEVDFITENNDTILGKVNNKEVYSHKLTHKPNKVKASNIDSEQTNIKWNNYRSFISLIVLGLVIAAFNILIFKFLFQVMDNIQAKIGFVISSILLIVINLIFLMMLIFYIFGNQQLNISNKTVTFTRNIFGKTYYSKSFNTASIAKLNIDFDTESNAIVILNNKGVELEKELIKRIESGNLKQMSAMDLGIYMYGTISALQSNTIIIESSALALQDKLYIDELVYSCKLNADLNQ